MARDESFFNVLRLLLLALNSDGRVVDEERAWLHKLMDAHQFRDEDKLTIEKDLAEPPDLRDLLRTMSPTDRDKLPAFVETAVTIDGRIEPRELEFLSRIRKLVDATNRRESERELSDDPWSKLADALVGNEIRQQMWNALKLPKTPPRRYVNVMTLVRFFRRL